MSSLTPGSDRHSDAAATTVVESAIDAMDGAARTLRIFERSADSAGTEQMARRDAQALESAVDYLYELLDRRPPWAP